MTLPPILASQLSQMKNKSENIYTRQNYFNTLSNLRDFLDYELAEFKSEYDAANTKK